MGHLQENGFKTKVVKVDNLATIRASRGVSPELAGCHTAEVDGYVIEGHVPADVIRRLLDERPDIAGLAVPGMPGGSPGMEGTKPVRYSVIAFDGQGRRSVYEKR